MKSIITVLAGAALAIGVAACGGGDEAGPGNTEASEIDLVYSLYTREVAFYRGLIEGAEAEAKRQGVNLDVQVSGADPTEQIDQLENAILQQPDGIILSAIDATAVEPVLDQATEAGIPVIGLGDDFGAFNRGEAGEGRVSFIGQDMELFGTQKTEFIFEQLKREGRLDGAKVAAFYGVRGVPFDVATRAGIQGVVKKYPQVEFIEGPYAGEYSAPAGLKAAQNVLSAHPDIDALICDQSDTCLGAVRAIEEAGIKDDEILVSSGDGQQPELDLIRKGKIDFTIAYCAYDEGELVVRQLVELIRDGKLPPEHTVDLGRTVAAPGIKALKSANVDTETVTAKTEPLEKKCSSPRIEVANAKPNIKQLEALGVETDG